SHKPDEVFDVADRITVLRDGKRVATAPTAEWTDATLVAGTVGRDLSSLFPRSRADQAAIRLEARHLRRPRALHRVSLAERSSAREYVEVQRMIETLAIRAASHDVHVSTLSGGNQQKIVIGRWLMIPPKVLILDEPTRGIDVGAKAEVHAIIDRLAGDGLAVLFISSELPEILGMSDRILVMRNGTLVGEFSRRDATEERIMQVAVGVTRH